MEYNISLTNWKDFAELLTLQRDISHEVEHLAVTKKDRKDSMFWSFAKAILHRKRVYTFIAKDNGKLIGYITVVTGKFLKVRETAYIVMGVAADYRGKGVGTQLLAKAEEFARSQNMHRIELEVFDRNVNAIRLYEKLGFVMEGRRREAIKTADGYQDIIWMGKLLESKQDMEKAIASGALQPSTSYQL